MSWEACAWVWNLELPSSEKWTLMGLANYCDEEGRAWPSLNKLADKLSVSRPTVIENIKRLTERGLIVKERRSNNSSIYLLMGVKKFNRGSQETLQGEGLRNLTGGLRNLTPRGKETLPNPIIEPSKDTTIAPSKRQKGSKANPQVKLFLQWWCERYKQVVKDDYMVQWGKEGAIVKKLLESQTLEETKKRAERLLATTDKWLRQRRTIPMLSSKWNELGQQGAGAYEQDGPTDLRVL